jgi:hypothetical protein
MALACRDVYWRALNQRATLFVVFFSIALLVFSSLGLPIHACSAQTPGAKAFVADVVSGTYCSASGCFTAASGAYSQLDRDQERDGLALPAVLGDWNTKLVSVYGGDRSQWYK